MHIAFWGTRGSIAKAGPSTLRYGGNTSCVEIRSDGGTLIVLDCGTGAHGLGQALLARSGGAPTVGQILISHTHWDHIQGLPFFAPLFVPGSSWHIYGPRGVGQSLSTTLAGQMEYAYFPVALEQLAGVVDYHDLVEGTFEVGDVRITTEYLNHPALTLGYRLQVDGATVVYASDHEPYDVATANGGNLASSRKDQAHARFFEGADLVIHDAQYLAHEYPGRVGWGHSPVEYVVSAAHASGARRLALFHHDPGRTDDELDAVVELARAQGTALGYRGEIFAAAEGLELELRGEATSPSAATRAATSAPAFDELDRAVLIAVHGPEISDLLDEAATAEGLTVWRAADSAEALEIARTRHPSIILVEEDDDVHELTRQIRALDPPYGPEVGVVAVTRTSAGPHGDDAQSITDWLIWPSSSSYVRTKLHAWLVRRACRWQPAPTPPDEERRLRSLHGLKILDTPPEARFDHLVELARVALDTPVALVSLVDSGRQWFKAHAGIDVQETPRDLAICSHAILTDDVFQVPDALEDDRFADNPLVAGDPRVRFYAGVPLKLRDGSRVGTLCVIDYRPRLLDEAKLNELQRLGALVTEELERP